MSDAHEKTYGITYAELTEIRNTTAAKRYVEPEQIEKLLDMVERLQSENIGMLEEKEELLYDMSIARESARPDIEKALYERDRLRDGYDRPPLAPFMCPGCTQKDGKTVAMCRLHEYIYQQRNKIEELSLDKRMLQACVDWQKWLLDEVEAEDLARETGPEKL